MPVDSATGTKPQHPSLKDTHPSLKDTERNPPSTKVLLLSRIRCLDDHEAWQRFVDLYTPLIMRYCRRRGLQEADALDVSQAVFSNISRAIGQFEYDATRGRFRSWLGVVTLREIHRHLDKASRTAIWEYGAATDVWQTDAEVDSAWQDEFNMHLYRCALDDAQAAFDETTWRAFQMTWVYDIPAQRAARTLGKPIGWVYKAKFRVLQRLKQQIEYLSSDVAVLWRND
jgi:RNA polymerase sigma-70 factor (ECF subfamily)